MENMTRIRVNGMADANVDPEEKAIYRMLRERAELLKNRQETPLFRTNAGRLFDEVFREGMPAEMKQIWGCNTCRQFVNTYGGLVTIDEKGNQSSFLWSADLSQYPDMGEEMEKAIRRLNKAVSMARVTGAFVPNSEQIGKQTQGGFHHMCVKFPAGMVLAGGEAAANYEESRMNNAFGKLMRAVRDYGSVIADRAWQLGESGSLYRFETIKDQIRWFRELTHAYEAAKGQNKAALIWYAVATAPVGYTKMDAAETLYEDLQRGSSMNTIANHFRDRIMTNYQVATTAPTAEQVEKAADKVERLGLTESLQRRYAKKEELPEEAYQWKPAVLVEKEAEKSDAMKLFAGIAVRQEKKAEKTIADELPSTVMTFSKFRRTVLPQAKSMKALVDKTGRFMAMVTAADPEAKNILRWDDGSAESRMSWYYAGGGIDGEFKRRVENAGGRYENCDIRASLMWDNQTNGMFGTDLDLHCITPNGEHIFYGHMVGLGGGALDVDANRGGHRTPEPVENIRWAAGTARMGHYQFYVQNYVQKDPMMNTFKVELQVGDQTICVQDTAGRTGYQKTMFEFDYVNGTAKNLRINGTQCQASAYWNLPRGTFVPVNGIITSPNMWGKNAKPQIGEHFFFLLEGCRDDQKGKARGFIPETLIPELHEHRRTLQAFTEMTEIQGIDEADACGMGFNAESDWNLTLRVEMEDGTKRLIKIDRFD